MLRWLGPRKAPEPNDGQADRITNPGLIPSIVQEGAVTDDPLAALDSDRKGQKQIYSVSRSVFLPRVTLKNNTINPKCCYSGGGVNPLFRECPESLPITDKGVSRQRSPHPGEKSSSSGYGGSNECSIVDPLYIDHSKLRDDALAVLEQNPNYVRSIKVAARMGRNRSIPSSGSGSSGGGTLTTIPEGKVDAPVPKPIWPRDRDKTRLNYDSIVDEALLLYTSLSYIPEGKDVDDRLELSVKEVLVELLNNINATMDGNTELTPEEMLKAVNEKISSSIEILKLSTEEEMKKLCINLSNCRKINSVLRAFSNASSSGNSSLSSPKRNGGRIRKISSETEDLYHLPTGSSSSGFSELNALPVFIHEDLSSVPNGVRNAMIYGTLYRAKCAKNHQKETLPKKNSLRAVNDNKPSVWEQYYGVKAASEGEAKNVPKPTDVPLYPGGRPEADFTLDVPRSEMLSKRMKEDKKWRCRCRLLTSFLGLVFFLLSVMAVSLMLTRGKRMFGSMM